MANLRPEQQVRWDAIKAQVRANKTVLSQKVAAIAEKDASLATLQARFETLKNTQSWAEIDLNSQIEVGTRVRYLLRTYECTTAHTKSLLRLPTNGGYWAELGE